MEDIITKNLISNDVSKLAKNFDFDLTKIDYAKIKEFIFKDQKRACKLITNLDN